MRRLSRCVSLLLLTTFARGKGITVIDRNGVADADAPQPHNGVKPYVLNVLGLSPFKQLCPHANPTTTNTLKPVVPIGRAFRGRQIAVNSQPQDITKVFNCNSEPVQPKPPITHVQSLSHKLARDLISKRRSLERDHKKRFADASSTLATSSAPTHSSSVSTMAARGREVSLTPEPMRGEAYHTSEVPGNPFVLPESAMPGRSDRSISRRKMGPDDATETLIAELGSDYAEAPNPQVSEARPSSGIISEDKGEQKPVEGALGGILDYFSMRSPS